VEPRPDAASHDQEKTHEVPARQPFCAACGARLSYGDAYCDSCGTQVTWTGVSPTLIVTGSKAEEVEAITRNLAAVLGPAPRVQKAEGDQADKPKKWWATAKAAWALAIGLATIIGGICAVIALFVHGGT
jgi:hypothetical protein